MDYTIHDNDTQKVFKPQNIIVQVTKIKTYISILVEPLQDVP